MKKMTEDKTLSKQVNVNYRLLIHIYQIHICYGKHVYGFMLPRRIKMVK